jgi:tetratricopeptide (TPR) repeat protein
LNKKIISYRNKIFFALLILFCSDLHFCQEYLEEQFSLAQNLYKQEKYFDAVTEFKRLQFFDKEGIYDFESNKLIAECYKAGGKFNEAIRFFTLSEINAENTDDLFEIKIDIIRVNILRRTTSNAIKLLDEMVNEEQWSDKINEINYWRGWAYVFEDQWDLAALEFSKISSDHELKILCEETHQKKYSATFAQVASAILPGAGQFYTGNYLSGLLSLAWCGLWGYTAIDAFVEDRIFDGLAVTNLLFFRFYRGNLQNAARFAREENIKIANESLNYLQHNYKGPKP